MMTFLLAAEVLEELAAAEGFAVAEAGIPVLHEIIQ
jgi:hypothetical protein